MSFRRSSSLGYRLGRTHRKSQNLWSDEIAAIPSTAFGERELEEAFIEGMAFLQKYPLEAVGGIEKVLQTAYDLAAQREALVNTPRANGPAVGLGARLRDTVWKGLSSGLESHPEEDYDSEDASSDEYEAEKPAAQQGPQSTLTSRLANTVWRGITNQSATEPPLSPSPSSSPIPSPLPSPLPTSQSSPGVPPREAVANAAARFWGYAEKLKESDTAASFSKVTTNWRVKALDAWNKPRTNEPVPDTLSPTPPASRSAPSMSSAQDHSRSISLTALQSSPRMSDDKRGSMPIMDRKDVYSPPPRPAFFRPVRDSMFVASPISREASPVSDSGHGARGSLSSFQLPTTIPPRSHSGPRPLLLNSSSLITAALASPARSPISPAADSNWADSVRAKRDSHRASQSSISSLSPSEPYRPRRSDTRSDFESDGGGGSRIVPINRNKSPSPMARASRRVSSRTSVSPPTPPKAHRRFPTESETSTPEPESNGQTGWKEAPPDSPTTTIPSPPLPGTPDAETMSVGIGNSGVRVTQPESQRQRGSVVLSSESADVSFASPAPETKLARRRATLSRMQPEAGDHSDSSIAGESPVAGAKNPNLRRKRLLPRLQSLRNSKASMEAVPPLPAHSQSLDVPPSDEFGEHEGAGAATTPRAGSFDEQMVMPPSPRRRSRKVSGEGETTPSRTRKISNEGRTRKISTEGRRKGPSPSPQRRDSAAVEGDDEGYNDLLSAYESEDQ